MRLSQMSKNQTWTYRSTTTVTSQLYSNRLYTIEGVTFNYRTKTSYSNQGTTVTFTNYDSFTPEVIWQRWNDPQSDPSDVAYRYGTASSSVEIYQDLGPQSSGGTVYVDWKYYQLSTIYAGSYLTGVLAPLSTPVSTPAIGWFYCSPGLSNVKVDSFSAFGSR